MTAKRPASRTRRRVLASIGAVLCGVALAGCADDTDSGNDGSGAGGTDGSSTADGSGADSDPEEDGADGGTVEESTPASEDPAVDCDGEMIHEGYQETAVRILRGGTKLGAVTAAIADTDDTRRLGLSDTDCLPDDRGMLFVFDTDGSRSFWMQEMDFGIDIVYIAEGGTITSIHHAEAPADDESGREQHHQYPGEGQYVLEVPYRWTAERGIASGDSVLFEL
jgi:uncharacterized membrane protein (UPF0127 family)